MALVIVVHIVWQMAALLGLHGKARAHAQRLGKKAFNRVRIGHLCKVNTGCEKAIVPHHMAGGREHSPSQWLQAQEAESFYLSPEQTDIKRGSQAGALTFHRQRRQTLVSAKGITTIHLTSAIFLCPACPFAKPSGSQRSAEPVIPFWKGCLPCHRVGAELVESRLERPRTAYGTLQSC